MSLKLQLQVHRKRRKAQVVFITVGSHHGAHHGAISKQRRGVGLTFGTPHWIAAFLQFVEVQPGDGFGTLLPQETLPLDVIFSARKPREYSFELTCKTGTDG